MIQVGEDDHPEFGKITERMSSIVRKGETSTLQAELDPTKLVPGKKYLHNPVICLSSTQNPPLFLFY